MESQARAERPTAAGPDYAALVDDIRRWGRELGFTGIGITNADVSAATPALLHWLALGRHGEMDYMAKHATLRAAPDSLHPGTISVISARLPYWPEAAAADAVLADGALAYVSRYALGRDYHKPVRNRLQKLAERIRTAVEPLLPDGFGYRVFSDSAPVMEVEFARKSGIAWRGKHTLSLTRDGSWHFLGEIYTSLPLPADAPIDEHCGRCRRCLDACPTAAIVAPYEVDARRCISYLTIESHDPIPPELRPAIGNKVYGCDDCQLVCPWNRHAQRSTLPDFDPRLGSDSLLALWAWDEPTFLRRTEGSPLRRIGFARWRRNLAVALGNAWRDTGDAAIAQALAAATDEGLAREHIDWALAQRSASSSSNVSGRLAMPSKVDSVTRPAT